MNSKMMRKDYNEFQRIIMNYLEVIKILRIPTDYNEFYRITMNSWEFIRITKDSYGLQWILHNYYDFFKNYNEFLRIPKDHNEFNVIHNILRIIKNS